MATFESLQQRIVGQPKASQVPGGPPTPSMPNQNVNPPAAASAPVGRPPAQPSGGTGAALPLSSGAASSYAPGTPGSSSQRPRMPGGNQPPSQSAPPNPGVEANPAGMQPGQGGMVVTMDRVPSRSELATMPPGTVVTTPYGQVTDKGELIPSPEGAQKYQAAILDERKKFGPHPFEADPNAPPVPVKLGRKSFNPFTGGWTEPRSNSGLPI